MVIRGAYGPERRLTIAGTRYTRLASFQAEHQCFVIPGGAKRRPGIQSVSEPLYSGLREPVMIERNQGEKKPHAALGGMRFDRVGLPADDQVTLAGFRVGVGFVHQHRDRAAHRRAHGVIDDRIVGRTIRG